jgi:2-keto-4-pentenoate hydratase/2-oxohepta-3-ene-1,7-dioic acid hydratase in catechol pathway
MNTENLLNENKIGRIFCIGRNYAAHARELNDDIPESPIIFTKFPSCLVKEGNDVHFPEFGNDLHHEVELVVLIGKEGKAVTVAEADTFIAGLAIGLDLTMRDVQFELLKNSLPWEKSKAFDESAPIGDFISYDPKRINLKNIEFSCRIDGELKQQGNTANMIFPVHTLIMELSKVWKLMPGDIIYTGTPEGIGPIKRGQTISIYGLGMEHSWKIV